MIKLNCDKSSHVLLTIPHLEFSFKHYVSTLKLDAHQLQGFTLRICSPYNIDIDVFQNVFDAVDLPAILKTLQDDRTELGLIFQN